MVGRAARVAAVVVAIAGAALGAHAFAAPNELTVNGGCRDGRAQGPYELRNAGGQLRVAGAFNEGARTGSFIFWRDNGAREAHVPYDNGLRNGTVATWYEAAPGREPPRHVESEWRHGLRDGITRTWYPDGRRRSRTEYAQGRIAASDAWSETGQPLPSHAARALAQADEKAEDAAYERRSALISAHMPSCGRST